MNAKIRKAQLQKIPYMLVAGDKEVEAETVAVRLRSGEDLKAKSIDEFLSLAREGYSCSNMRSFNAEAQGNTSEKINEPQRRKDAKGQMV